MAAETNNKTFTTHVEFSQLGSSRLSVQYNIPTLQVCMRTTDKGSKEHELLREPIHAMAVINNDGHSNDGHKNDNDGHTAWTTL